MRHRFLLGMLVLMLGISAPAAQLATEGTTAENWIVSSDEGGGGSSYMGVDIADVTTERLSELKLKEEHGAEITMVDQDAPAGKAGLHEHDVILSVNGTNVESAAQLRRMIKETPAGRVVTLGISRDGQPMSIKVQLADRKKSISWAPEPHEFKFEMPEIKIPDIDIPVSVVIAHSSLRNGLMVENITPQLGDFFGVKGGKGALVRSVEKGSRGEKAGFRAGDVVVKVNDQLVHDASDFTHALRETQGDTATVTVMRDRKEQTLTILLPARKDSGRLNALDVADMTAELHNAESFAPRVSTEAIEKSMEAAAEAQEQAEEAAKDAAQEAQDACHEKQEEQQREIEQQIEEQKEQVKEQQQDIQEQIRDRQEQVEEQTRAQQEQVQEQQEQLQEQMQEKQEQIQKQIQDQQERVRDQEKTMQDRQRKLEHEMSGEWTEI